MTTPAVLRLPLLLTQEVEWNLHLDGARADELKSAAQFWVPAKPPVAAAACRAALARVFASPAEMAPRLAALPAPEQAILAIFKRYGGAMSGTLLRAELLARGLTTLPATRDGFAPYSPRQDAPYTGLVNKFLLAPLARNFFGYFSFGSGPRYPDLAANPASLVPIIAAEPAPWYPDCPAPPPTAVTRGSLAEVVLDLWAVAQELARNDGWKPTRTGSIPKPLANKLRKVLPPPSTEVPSVPDLPVLYCDLLGALGVIAITEEEGRTDLTRLQEMLSAHTEPLAFVLAGVWRFLALWQDGVGGLSERDADYRADELSATRELLIWGLGALARGPDGWFDLESFLRQLWDVQRHDTPRFFTSEYGWAPAFARAQPPAKATEVDRLRALWLHDTGVCCANALLGTFVHLGLIERGPVADGEPLVFRPTALGRVVFGAPEVTSVLPAAPESRFFTLQPNFDVVASVDAAPPGAIWPLARIARRTSAPGGPVQTFAIDRASVYQALEGGFTLERIREYLTAHARNAPPPNVMRTLEEWGGKRDSLVLRRGVSLLVGSTSPPKAARAVGEGFHLLDGSAPGPKGVPSVTYPDRARACGEADEYGTLRLDPNADLVAAARLRQLAGAADGGELAITAASVAAAKRRGLSAEQLLTRLRHHHRGPVPAMLEVAIRNWSGGGQVMLDNLLMLRVPDAAVAAAVLQSERFKPFIVRHIPPEWFVVDGKRRKELEKLLAGVGYTWTADV